ncbi:hypothetical protein NDU88_004196 [Pleurodeles waltl]|uniref:Uncharacterized protein n=1 Tax=Pleurodeles waltl TaxID=8319 RepID=A0AAV7W5X7_PLEWA|nr:hypothetical protein NDU88_004196 [Pleurodeles waltl]
MSARDLKGTLISFNNVVRALRQNEVKGGVFRYPGGRFPQKNKNKVAAGGVFRYPGGRFPRKNKNKVAAGKWGGSGSPFLSFSRFSVVSPSGSVLRPEEESRPVPLCPSSLSATRNSGDDFRLLPDASP